VEHIEHFTVMDQTYSLIPTVYKVCKSLLVQELGLDRVVLDIFVCRSREPVVAEVATVKVAEQVATQRDI
jgi:hypothetical protein